MKLAYRMPCLKTVILSVAKDLPCVDYLGETLRQAQGDTLEPTFEAKPLQKGWRVLERWSKQRSFS